MLSLLLSNADIEFAESMFRGVTHCRGPYLLAVTRKVQLIDRREYAAGVPITCASSESTWNFLIHQEAVQTIVDAPNLAQQARICSFRVRIYTMQRLYPLLRWLNPDKFIAGGQLC